MSNTERLIEDLEHAVKHGVNHLRFRVGKFTGNSPSVIGALRRRGYKVHISTQGYILYNK